MAFEAVDITPLRDGDLEARKAVAARIDEAYRTSGFLQVTGHGIPQAQLDEMLDVTAAFFDLPEAEKRQVVDPDPAANRGYSGEGEEALAYSLGEDVAAPDLFEAFNVGREDATGDYYDEHRRFFAPNTWPAAPAELREVWLRHQANAWGVADVLLRCFALGLDLDEEFFIDRTRRAIITTRAINYERRPGSPDPLPGQLRMGAHTDYGILTILLADNVPGLQVRHDGGWVDVPVEPGSLIINIGDMMATWTNDRWVSTIHRVVPPPAGESGPVRRRSVAQFFEADPDCVIECLPSCTSADNPPRYEPVEAGEYLLAKILGPRTLQKSAAGTTTGGR